MAIKTYSKGSEEKLSDNFYVSEFACHGKGCCGIVKVDEKLVSDLQKIRNHFGKPVTINSGYRCSTHNKNVGGVSNSYHTNGQAVDITVKDVAPAEVAKYAESIGILGIGLYETDRDGHFVHIDTRTSKSYWYGQKQEYRGTFGGTTTKGGVSMNIKTGQDLATACIDVASNYKTLYVMGCFGAPMNESNKKVYINHHSYNRRADRQPMINAATADTFGFDCVCLIKGLLWGWSGDTSKVYGGATYASNGVPDIDADAMIRVCSDVSTDFSNIQVGEVVWLTGHIGVYIGNGLAVECSPAWKNNVQITAVKNIGTKSGYNARTWTKHGKLPYVTYEKVSAPVVKEETTPKLVVDGVWGSATTRRLQQIFGTPVDGVYLTSGQATRQATPVSQVAGSGRQSPTVPAVR